jgi:hypothetical protein
MAKPKYIELRIACPFVLGAKKNNKKFFLKT